MPKGPNAPSTATESRLRALRAFPAIGLALALIMGGCAPDDANKTAKSSDAADKSSATGMALGVSPGAAPGMAPGIAPGMAAGMSSGAGETPREGLEAILALHEAGDYDGLVRTRYAEISKADEAGKVEALIHRMQTHFSDPAKREELVAVYEEAMAAEPKMEMDGTVAVFHIQAGMIRLSKLPSGEWGFHL